MLQFRQTVMFKNARYQDVLRLSNGLANFFKEYYPEIRAQAGTVLATSLIRAQNSILHF